MTQFERIQPFGRRDRERYEPPSGEQTAVLNNARRALYQFHIREGQRRDVIDFELVRRPKYIAEEFAIEKGQKPSATKVERIVSRFEGILGAANKIPTTFARGSHDWDFAKAQIQGTYWYAQRRRQQLVEERRPLLEGEKLNSYEYIEKATGVDPQKPIPPELISEHREAALMALRDMGISTPTDTNVAGWMFDHELTPDDAIKQLRDYAVQAMLVRSEFLGENINVDFSVNRINKREAWTVWAGTDLDEIPGQVLFVLLQNFFKSGGIKGIQTPGKLLVLAQHEGDHLQKMAKRKQLVDQGKLHPFYGLTTTHGPEASVTEGSADTQAAYIPGLCKMIETNPEALFYYNEVITRQLVWGVVHQQINNPEGYKHDQIVEYVRTMLPWTSVSSIEDQIKWRTLDPLNQAYLYSYAAGDAFFLEAAKKLSTEGKRQLSRAHYARGYTLTQAQERFQLLSQVPKNLVSKQTNELA